MKRLNNDWEYTSVWSEEFLQGGPYEEIVRIQSILITEMQRKTIAQILGSE